jgi:RimJ/RimL family protein N-acetyltransferase
MPRIAETPRLFIQTWELTDHSALMHLTRQSGISEYSTSGYADFTDERARFWIANELERFRAEKLARFAVISKELGVPIGISGIFRQPNLPVTEADMNYRYPVQYRGKGFATEAAQAILRYGFVELGLDRINANVDLNNAASLKVIERLGMKVVGPVFYEGIEARRFSMSRRDFGL